MNAVVALQLRPGHRPVVAAYLEGGRVLAALAAREGVDVSRAGSLVNDLLIAASCREAGAHLVTENVGDYAVLQRHLRGCRFVVADDVLQGGERPRVSPMVMTRRRCWPRRVRRSCQST